jgi:glycosyltransferase involved in cell wall biosynthesis
VKKVKVTYIISDIDKALAFEWISAYINRNQFELSFILLNPGASHLEEHLKASGGTVYRVMCRGKNDWPSAIIKTYSLLKQIKPDIVHCHLIQANIIGLLSAKLAGIEKRVYTRHHSSLHHIYFRKGVWWDKLANTMATHIVAISGIVKDILINWEKADLRKVVLIPHGFQLSGFEHADQSSVTAFKQRHAIEDKGPVIGVVSRFTIWKGIQYVIPAFKDFLQIYPNAVLLLLNAKGDYEQEIKKALNELPPSSFRLIAFEKDIASAYNSMDAFVHVPIDEHSEAFGQIYVEALASKVPSVFTLSGIAPNFVKDRENALVVPYKDSERIYNALLDIFNDSALREKIKTNGLISVKEKYDLNLMIQNLEELYAGE